MEDGQIKCVRCRKKLDRIDLDFYLLTDKKVCTDCEGKDLDEQGDRLDRLYEELSEQ